MSGTRHFMVEAHLTFLIETNDDLDMDHEAVWLEDTLKGVSVGKPSALEELIDEAVEIHVLDGPVAMSEWKEDISAHKG